MLLSDFLDGRSCGECCRKSSPVALFLLFATATSFATDSARPLDDAGMWGGFALGLILAIVVAVMARSRMKAAEAELARLKELAEHREYERNQAQHELVRRLEEERVCRASALRTT